ncbi:hypothetical protein LY76DRAFT_638747 [Colletotrichum caudatum]|nr:hypothetical protein LY76DRAFT_638747 [Colletotrichum caudatum]
MAKGGLDLLAPNVYAWAPPITSNKADEKGFGWIMSGFRSGVDLGPEFASLDVGSQKHVFHQMAAVLGAMQVADLPDGVTKFGGGLKFDSDGHIVNGESPSMQDVKPAGSYLEWRVGKLRSRLERAAGCPIIQGWKSNGVAIRIEKFLASGGPQKVLGTVDVHRKCLIHGDLTIYNMLYDKNAKKVTAVLDFDFASISHPFEEFIYMSFSHTGGNVGNDNTVINRAIISGDFTTPPADLNEESAKEWELGKMWNTVLQESAALAPSQIEGVDQIRDLMRLQSLLFPYRLSSVPAAEGLDDERRAGLREKAEAELTEWLTKHGY